MIFASSPRPSGRCRTWFEADGKASIERLYLYFPNVEKPLNSKVIKSFLSELRSRKCFSCFGIPMFYIYIHVMNILCTFHISISWVCYWRTQAEDCYIDFYAINHAVLPYLELYIFLDEMYSVRNPLWTAAPAGYPPVIHWRSPDFLTAHCVSETDRKTD